MDMEKLARGLLAGSLALLLLCLSLRVRRRRQLDRIDRTTLVVALQCAHQQHQARRSGAPGPTT
jgi:hypothetical protein